MNFLFILDEYPFPARNGVTVPVSNLIQLLTQKGHRVDILLFELNTNNSNIDKVNYAKNDHITAYSSIKFKRKSLIPSFINEILTIEPVFMSWNIVDQTDIELLLDQYDVIWTSPIRPFGIWIKIRSSINVKSDYIVAAINDSYSMTLTALSKKASIAFRFFYKIRALAIKHIERKLLPEADLICVQSRVEIEFLSTVLDSDSKEKLFEFKNGVSDKFLTPRLPHKYDLLFVGVLDDNYRPTIQWFINKVYSRFTEIRPTFCIISSTANESDINFFKKFDIVHIPFVSEIDQYYLSSKILIAPIFKGFGTINKVLEAMAAGCVVIGDNSAFNGIEAFVPGRDGIVAATEGEFYDAIYNILSNENLAFSIGHCARILIKNNFSWNSRLNYLSKRLPLPI